jgi:predicted Ser/Thr protein kinase
MRYLFQKFKDVLNRMVSFELKRGNYFELGEFVDFLASQIPYLRLRRVLDGMKKWEWNSLKLADERITLETIRLQCAKKIEVLASEPGDGSADNVPLYPINIICQLLDFLYLYQNRRRRFFKTKVRIGLERNETCSICKLYANVAPSEHWFNPAADRQLWDIIHQYTTAANLHSPHVHIERLNQNGHCLILIQFDLAAYYQEEDRLLKTCRKQIAEYPKELTRNGNHVLYGCSGNQFVKIVDSRIVAGKKNSLHAESVFLNRLGVLDGFPALKKYLKIGDYEVLVTDRIKGVTLGEYLSGTNGEIETQLLFKLLDQIRKLRKNYVVHRDLKDSNIFISSSGQVFVTDFDQAMWNMDSGNGKVDLKKKSPFSTCCACVTLYDLLNSTAPARDRLLEIQSRLEGLWTQAAKSDSNSPGVEIAYYSYDFGDHQYHGERDFFERWLLLEKNDISLKDKVVVEMACNLGLFGAYSSLYGAKSVHCFDVDSDIIKCAKELSDIMELENVRHDVRDLNVAGSFDDVDKIDFMFATSVHFWLQDTTEFDRLMKLAKEVVYEGHEQYDIEFDRLKAWGFTEIKSIGITGRLRSVFYAIK